MPVPLFSAKEDEIVQHGFGNHYSDPEIVILLQSAGFHRGAKSVMRRRIRLGWIRRGEKTPRIAPPQKPKSIPGDAAFKLAMLRAIRNGDEKVEIGVVKDRRPFPLKTISAEPTHSGCGSAAGQCADAAVDSNRVW